MSDDFIETLNALRQRINQLDDALIGLLKQRIDVIHEVGALKRANTPADCHIRPGREGEMHRRIHDAFTGSDFPPAAALVIWRQIIGASTHLESPITVALASDTLSWHAREYFGRSVTCTSAGSIANACEAVIAKRATIALIPAPSDDSLVEWANLASYTELRVFAALPVVLADTESPACYAVAAVKNEASGDDMSLLLVPAAEADAHSVILARNAKEALVLVEGVSADARCLGTLPKPIIDPSLQPW